MIQTVEKGKTLLVDGPARVSLLSGRASIWGTFVESGEEIIVRKGKRMPFEALCASKLELTLGNSASYTKIDGSSIPSSWRRCIDEILPQKEQKIVLVMGGVDSGKTSFCTYLANLALNARYHVGLIDGDPGQSDLGPPGTVSLSFVQEPVVDLFRSRPESLTFIGITSPSKKIGEILEALVSQKEEALEKGVNLLIINTDGWVEGDDAIRYKVRLVKAVRPDTVVALQKEEELVPILGELKDVKAFVIDSPEAVKKRDRETRKLLRESAYKKYLKEAKVRSFPLNWVQIEGDLRFDSNNTSQLKNRLEKILGREVLHCEEMSDCVLFLVRKGTRLKEEEVKKLESEFGRQVIGLYQGEEEGILVALEDARSKVLGIGTIRDIDYENKAIKIYTPANDAVSKIKVGRIKLDKEDNEIGWILENL